MTKITFFTVIGGILLVLTAALVFMGQRGCDNPNNDAGEFSLSQQMENKKVGSTLIALSGSIVPIGHEPFVKLAIITPEGDIYVIRGDKKPELYNVQGKAIRVEGFLEVIGSPRSKRYINVRKYELLNLQNDILSLQIRSGLESLTIDFADGNYMISRDKENTVDRVLLAKLHNSVSDIYQSWLEAEEFSIDPDKCYFMLKILYTQRVPITLWKPSGVETSLWVIEQHKKKAAIASVSVTNAVVSIIDQLNISINGSSQ